MRTECFPAARPDWLSEPISTLADVNPPIPTEPLASYPFVEMAAVAEDFGGITSLEQREANASGLARFAVGDTLFAKITPCPENGKIAFVHALPGPVGLGSTEFVVLSPRSDNDARFVFHLACSSEVRGHAVARMEGSTGRQRVPIDVFTKWLLVPIPSPTERTAIADVLDALEATQRAIRMTIDRARAIRTSLRQSLFSRGLRGETLKSTSIGPIPQSWEVLPVSAVVRTFQYGLSLAMEDRGDIPILRMGNIQDGGVMLDDLKYLNIAGAEAQPYRLHRGDVLFNRTNSNEWVGKVGIFRHDFESVFASYLIRLVHDASAVDSYFLGQLLSSHEVQCRIKRYATPGVEQVNINASNLGRVLIPMPVGTDGIREQRQVANVLEASEALIRANEVRLAASQRLMRGLMSDLFNGRVRLSRLEAPSYD